MNGVRRPGRAACLAAALVLLPASSSRAGDALDEALAAEGLVRADLGWEPRGYWSRYPADTPHRLRHFDDLLAQPLATVTFARTASNAAKILLSADSLAKRPEKSDGALYRAVQILGVDRKFGAFRNYSANLDTTSIDLVDALLLLHESAGRKTSFVTFGNVAAFPDLRKEWEAKVAAGVPARARPALGRLVADLVSAHEWCELAFRNVPVATRLAVQRRTDLGVELGDAQEYFPELDDAAALLDEASLWYGSLRAVAAVERARHALSAVDTRGNCSFDWYSPLGWIRFHGSGEDEIDGTDSFLVVDLGGGDSHEGSAGAPAPGRSLSVLLELGGNDMYHPTGDGPKLGAGLAGIGIVLDAAGDDEYWAGRCSQGFGQLGFGLLADLDGNDYYFSRYDSQGAAFLGIGTLLDAAGDDTYRIESDGQGFGAAGGVGTLADRSGNDRYEAVRDPAVTGRPSSHSEDRISISNAQGVGSGRRGDGSDGHSWAGGLGQLIDVEGDDEYVAGNWSQGAGYWFGTGLLHDASGNDTYRGVVWSQGSGAHFCIGALIDESGDDRHLIEEKGSASVAFGHDFTVALHVDVAGNDEYDVFEGDGLGFSINRSVALLIDCGGDDRYRNKPGNRPGFARFDERFARWDDTHTYFTEASALGLFLDVGGRDSYEADAAADDSTWLDPAESANRAARNLSIGVDRADGTVDLAPRPEREPSRR
ncbi:MAG: hypothetical protein ACT4PE_17955 [Candidatus Eiseniibacteriota bacterium]